MKRIGEMLLGLLNAGPSAFILSCGINAQQNGYKQHDTFLMFMGVALIASALSGYSRMTKHDSSF